ncbi:DUF2490 domain-containing protein [Chryseosolibacter indicus]|uniref:DUF2490 domain-containing protein n=1 Tax=Chryseosolibacter indicus TaxID=2782351 RepID=A0ABS5VQW1_9BACT|nr:DUF2490 domain-containing protein [Chryseosolibacter indicus]MBT1703840.1 DUF2490 domain-containing protein [Chryseosolibacter indicus]
MIKIVWIACIGILSVISLYAQVKTTDRSEMTWVGYFNQTRFTDKSGLWLDLHLRLNDEFVNEVNQTIIRGAYIYYFSDNARLNIGHAYVTRYGQGSAPNVPEQRPWAQIQWFEKKKYFNLMQWFRVEHRFRRRVSNGELTNDYSKNWRFRYNFALTLPLKGHQVVAKTPFIFFNDEIHINAGKEITNNYFDQNRLFLGLGYQFTSHLNAHLGYMYIFQQEPGNHFVHSNTIRLFVFHNIDWRDKSEPQ